MKHPQEKRAILIGEGRPEVNALPNLPPPPAFCSTVCLPPSSMLRVLPPFPLLQAGKVINPIPTRPQSHPHSRDNRSRTRGNPSGPSPPSACPPAARFSRGPFAATCPTPDHARASCPQALPLERVRPPAAARREPRPPPSQGPGLWPSLLSLPAQRRPKVNLKIR